MSPLQPVLRHIKLALGITLAGAVLGLGVAAVTPVMYTAETRLAVGTGELSNLNIPGYPTASAEMASDYARWVTETGAGGEVVADDDVTLQASPIPDSNVIRVEARSADSDAAISTADEAATALRDAVNEVREEDDPERIIGEIQAHAPAEVIAENRQAKLANIYRGILADYQAGTVSQETLEASRDQYTGAYTEWLTLDTEQTARIARYQRLRAQETTEADLTIVQPAEVTADDRASTLQRFGLVGLVLGGVSALIATHVLDRRRARRDVVADERTGTEAVAQADTPGGARRGTDAGVTSPTGGATGPNTDSTSGASGS